MTQGETKTVKKTELRETDSQFGALGDGALRLLREHQRLLAWTGFFVLLVLVATAVPDVTFLVFLSYGAALLMDPVIRHFRHLGLSRSSSIIMIYVVFAVVVGLTLVVAIPLVFREYHLLVDALPVYLDQFGVWVGDHLSNFLGVDAQTANTKLWSEVKDQIATLEPERLQELLKPALHAVLQGYSVTLTIVNLLLLPFFAFYIARDLSLMHRFVGNFMAPTVRKQVATVGSEILGHVYTFFRGQITVCLMSAVFYSIALWAAGLPWALAVGFLTGLLNAIPYLGMGVGVSTAAIITLANGAGLIGLLKIGAAFLIVHLIQEFVLVPKILGESLGIHPLGVMLALVVGGQLFGLVGLIIAIPAAAALRVLGKHLLHLPEIDTPESEAADAKSKTKK